ncbi:helix-turn-helix transcriptional regulator [bacterium]|nr:helix-turn-helix transcriptional regulator [bacterium]
MRQLTGRDLPAPRELVPCAGFAILLAVNATQVWGGVFPFLPRGFQTAGVTLTFYLAQMSAYVLTLLAGCVLAAGAARPAGAPRVAPATLVAGAGSALVIAAMYAPVATMGLVLAGGLMLGAGLAWLSLQWQRCFASMDERRCNDAMLIGTALGAITYFCLHLLPVALTAFLVPAVLLPLCALCLALASRDVDLCQPMFEDVPRDHPRAYRGLVRDLWRSMVSVAAMGFVCGLARGVAVAVPQVGDVVNVASMAGALVASLTLLVLSRALTASFGLTSVFRLLFAPVTICLVLLPLVRDAGLSLFAGLTYMAFSLVTLVMMMQCAQVSRDRGVRPSYPFGLFGTSAFAAQGAGFVPGWLTEAGGGSGAADALLGLSGADGTGRLAVAMLSLVAAVVMGLALLVITRASGGMASAAAREDGVEFLHVQASGAKAASVRASANALVARLGDAGDALTDRISKQCFVIRERYGLSAREAEVAERIARGQSVATIADELSISENTVRTHSKHIYTKLGIHARRELVDLLDAVDFSELGETVI